MKNSFSTWVILNFAQKIKVISFRVGLDFFSCQTQFVGKPLPRFITYPTFRQLGASIQFLLNLLCFRLVLNSPVLYQIHAKVNFSIDYCCALKKSFWTLHQGYIYDKYMSSKIFDMLRSAPQGKMRKISFFHMEWPHFLRVVGFTLGRYVFFRRSLHGYTQLSHRIYGLGWHVWNVFCSWAHLGKIFL